MKSSGKLVVAGTPIGNLGDVSPRLSTALGEAKVVACEDTRRTGQLLQLLGLGGKAPVLVSYHKDNEVRRSEELLARLWDGEDVLLVSDSGMPGISDPGARLVAGARALGIAVEVIPGPAAVAMAVTGSGLGGAFVFHGFLPRKGRERTDVVVRLGTYPETVVFYEAPGRVAETAADLLAAWGNRPAWLARELTKMHEEWVGADLAGLVEKLAGREVKGECTLVVGGKPEGEVARVVADGEILEKLADGGKTKAVAAWLAAAAGLGAREAYARVVSLLDKKVR